MKMKVSAEVYKVLMLEKKENWFILIYIVHTSALHSGCTTQMKIIKTKALSLFCFERLFHLIFWQILHSARFNIDGSIFAVILVFDQKFQVIYWIIYV